MVKYLALAVALEYKERAVGQKVLLVSEDLGGGGNPDGLLQRSPFTVSVIYSGKQCVLSPLLDSG